MWWDLLRFNVFQVRGKEKRTIRNGQSGIVRAGWRVLDSVTFSESIVRAL